MRIFILALLSLIICFACSSEAGTANNDSSTSDVAESTTESTAMTNPVDETDGNYILFFGNSLTAGYGLDGEPGFPELIQQKIDSLGLDYKIINSGISGETTSDGRSRIDWVLRQKVDVFVLELGANDGLRGIDTKVTRENLQFIMDKVKEKYPSAQILLTGMQVPPNMGPEYAADFRQVFKDLAEKNEVAFLPFLLEKVAGEPELNQGDGIHPTAEGQKIVAQNVWSVLKDLL